MNISKILTFAFIFRFPLMFLKYWSEGLNVPVLSTIILGVTYALEFYIIVYAVMHHHFNFKTSGCFWIIFIIYTIFIIKDIFITPLLFAHDIVAAPSSLWGVILFVILLFSYATCSSLWLERSNIIVICKSTAIIVPILMIAYFSQVGIATYAMMEHLSAISSHEKLHEMLPATYVSGLILAKYVCLGYLCCLFVWDKWTNSKKLNLFISVGIAAVCFFTMLITARRGPVIFSVLTTMVYFYAKNKFSGKLLLGVILGYIAIIVTLQFVDVFDGFFGRFFQRMYSIIEDGGSGRFGDSESVYNIAITQIINEPYWGSYFRLLKGNYMGLYPHNYILEFLMTFGFIFTIPVLIFNYKSIVVAIKQLNFNKNNAFWGLWLLLTSLRLLTSDTLVNNYDYWVAFAISFSYYKRITNNPNLNK